jgi:hypothetical protein
LAIDEENAVARKLAESHLRTREISQNSDRPANLRSYSTNPVIPLEGEFE